MAQTLLDQKEAGKMLLLITNSDYEYTARMMTFAYDRFLPGGMTWRDLFDMVCTAHQSTSPHEILLQPVMYCRTR
jgi:hypothetical protein